MIEREEKDGIWDEKKKAFAVFIFYAKKRRSRCERTTKKVQKRKVWYEKRFQKRQAKDTFNLMVQQLRLEEESTISVSTGESLIVFIAKLLCNIISYWGTIVDLKLHWFQQFDDGIVWLTLHYF